MEALKLMGETEPLAAFTPMVELPAYPGVTIYPPFPAFVAMLGFTAPADTTAMMDNNTSTKRITLPFLNNI